MQMANTDLREDSYAYKLHHGPSLFIKTIYVGITQMLLSQLGPKNRSAEISW